MVREGHRRPFRAVEMLKDMNVGGKGMEARAAAVHR